MTPSPLPPRALHALIACAALAACGAPAPDRGPTESPLAVASPGSSAAGAPAVPAGQSREVTPREYRVIQQLMRTAEQVRGLRFVRDVPAWVQDADAIMAYVDGQIEDEELDRSRRVYVALGLLAADLEVRGLLLRLMGEQIVGYYDVEASRLSVRDDVMRAFESADADDAELSEARIVLVHELVHALQDQRLGLSDNVERDRDTDGDNAFRALIEGDATLAMLGFGLGREAVALEMLTRDPAQVNRLSQVVRSSPLAGDELVGAPAIVREPLLFAYVEGLSFAANLHGAGGWGRVDRAHAEPPASTEQVLHPARFARHEQPERPRLPLPEALAEAGYRSVHEDTLGELEMGVFFQLGVPGADARAAAEGWGGDRLYLLEHDEEPTLALWVSTWDDENEAIQAYAAATRAATAKPGGALVDRAGRALLIARPMPGALAPATRASFREWAGRGGFVELTASN